MCPAPPWCCPLFLPRRACRCAHGVVLYSSRGERADVTYLSMVLSSTPPDESVPMCPWCCPLLLPRRACRCGLPLHGVVLYSSRGERADVPLLSMVLSSTRPEESVPMCPAPPWCCPLLLPRRACRYGLPLHGVVLYSSRGERADVPCPSMVLSSTPPVESVPMNMCLYV